MEYLISLVFMLFLTLTMISLYLFSFRNIKRKYEFIKRKKRLDKKKVLKFYLYTQGFFLLCKLGNDMHWILVFLFPILLMMMLVSFYFIIDNSENINKDIDYNSEEYKQFEKQENRDKKINKILKW